MTRHIFLSTCQGRAVRVQMDRDPDQEGFHLVVEFVDCGELLYTSVADGELADMGGLSPSLEYLFDRLEAMGIERPVVLAAEIEADWLGRANSRVVEYDERGRLCSITRA